RHGGGAPGDQRLGRGVVIGRDSHHSVRFPIGVDAVDAVGWNVTVPPEITGGTQAAAAILNRILVAVYFDVVLRGGIDIGWQCPVIRADTAEAGDLPAADHLVDYAVRISGELFAAPHGQIDDEVPADLVLGRIRVALVVEEAVSLVL